MRIPCPHCGERDASEFTYLGDAALAERPDPAAPDALARFDAYVHRRDNPAGRHQELWYHGASCRAWLVVTRDVRTHAVEGAVAAREAALEGAA